MQNENNLTDESSESESESDDEEGKLVPILNQILI